MESALMFAGGGALAGQVKGVLDYNRTAWSTNVSMRQGKRYQQQNLVLSLVGMYREDIRDLVSSSMTTQGNYLIMNTLMLSMVLMCFQTASLPEGTPVHRQQLYTISVGASLVFLLLSILYTVMANQLAVKCQRSMLVNDVRLPIEAFAEQVDAASEIDNVEGFEAQGLATMFRIPGIGQFRRLFPKCKAPAEAVASELSHRNNSESYSDDSEDPMCGATEAVHEVTQKRSEHLDGFQRQEKTWNLFMKLALFFGILGVMDMMAAFSHYALAQVEHAGTNQFATAVPALLMYFVRAMMFKAAVCYLKRGASFRSSLGAVMILLGPVFDVSLVLAKQYGAAQSAMLFVIMEFAVHVLTLLLALHILHDLASKPDEAEETNSYTSRLPDIDEESLEGRSKATSSKPASGSKISRRNVTRSVQMAFVAVVIVVVAYCGTLGLSLAMTPNFAFDVLQTANNSSRRLDGTLSSLQGETSIFQSVPVAHMVDTDPFYSEAEEFLVAQGAYSAGSLRNLREDDLDVELRRTSLSLGAKALIRHWHQTATQVTPVQPDM